MNEQLTPNQNSQEKSVEQKKQEVIEVLEKFKDKIVGFSFNTNTGVGHYRGSFSTNMDKISDTVDENPINTKFKEFIEVVKLEEKPISRGLKRDNYSRYIFDKRRNAVTFIVPIGRGFADYRSGNSYYATIAFKEDDKTDKSELLLKIKELLINANYHYTNEGIDRQEKEDNENRDRYNIAKEGLPILEAFREIILKYQENKSARLNIDSLIQEYKERIVGVK